MKKIAIVTPELLGLYKNGGIGTNYFYRARFLQASGKCEVTVLYTGACSPRQAEQWRAQHGRPGIRLEVLPKFSADTDWETLHRRAMEVHQWLAAGTWDEIHLPDYLANGFVCLQAKRAGLAYQNTRLVVTMHSSSLWLREGMQQWSLNPETDTKLDYAERYCCENADTLIAASRFIRRWAERQGWQLPVESVVLPHLCEITAAPDSPPPPAGPRPLVFFGRLQTIKGLGIFCEAVGRLVQAGQAPARVDFLGAVATHEGLPADQYIRKMSAQWPRTKTNIHAGLDAFAAVQHLRRTGGLAVIPSLRDNLPYTVIECILNGIPFIASDACGIPELADPRVLFAPDARSLAAKIQEFSGLPPAAKFNHPYQPGTARAAWEKFLAAPFVPPAPPAAPPPAPKISVCVPFYNHGQYLAATLAALARQTYENFEVIVVDDGSTAAAARECFDRLQKDEKEFPAPRWRFFRTENAGVGAARNFAVTHATGDWLVFVDADNVPREKMLAVFARALQVSGADCATCHYAGFHTAADLEKPPRPTFTPLGPCLEAGWRENVFGDANFIVRKSIFNRLGGFTDRRIVVEDWEFLVRLALGGGRQIVIPEVLFWYRLLPDSMMRTADETRVARAILEAYRAGLAAWPGRIIENYAFGPYHSAVAGQSITTNSHATLTSRKPAVPRARRGKSVKKFQRSCVKRLLEFAEFVARL